MTIIRLHTHPFAGAAPEVIEVPSLALWLVERYERRPGVRFNVYAGEPSMATELAGERAILQSTAPVHTVLESPGAPLIPFLVQALVSYVISMAIADIFGPSAKKSTDTRALESPNNQLSDRQNRVRTMERVEDIYGTVRSIPTLLMPTYSKYIQNKRVEYGLYCVGRGYYSIDDVREADTPLSEIDGASAAIYWPFTSPNSGSPVSSIGDAIIDKVLTVGRSTSVEGIVLSASNQQQPAAGASYLFRGPGSIGNGAEVLPTTTLDVIYQPVDRRKPNFAAVCEVGQVVTIVMGAAGPQMRGAPGISVSVDAATSTYTVNAVSAPGIFRGLVNGSAITIDGTGLSDPANIGTKTVVSHTDNTVTVAEPCADELGVSGGSELTFGVSINWSGTRVIDEVGVGYIVLAGTPQYAPNFCDGVAANITVANGLVDWTDWFTLPSVDRTEVWTNVVAQAGMYKDDGAKSQATVAYEMQIEQLSSSLVPTGVVETLTGSISGATSNERAETLERLTGWTGPARVRMRRTTPFDFEFQGLVVDEIKWVDLYSVSPVTKPHFGNKTIIHTVTRTTAGSAAITRRELNCLASRLLPTFDGGSFSGAFDSEGAHVSGTIHPTSRIVDILPAVTLDPKIGARTMSDLDMAQIWATQLALDAWNTECGQFNYTFDSDSLSFEDTVQAIAGAAFCAAYRQNGQIRLALDRPQAAPVTTFTHRNKRPNAETITRTFSTESEYDGIELAYVDPETEKQETIRLLLDGSYTKLKPINVPGIRSYEQAWFRANREYNILRWQRVTIETETTGDARALLPNSRVEIVDNTRFNAFDGEVVAQSGLTLTLSRDVSFLPATPHSTVLMKRDGSLQSIACTQGAEANEVVLAAPPAEPVVTTPSSGQGIRTIFSFAADSARDAMAYLVREIEIVDGQYVRLRAVNYSPNYYTADALAVPAKNSVIN